MAANLAHWQSPDGSIGIGPGERKPAWPTSLALVAWSHIGGFAEPAARAQKWLLNAKGEPVDKTPDLGHDTSLIGWSWAEKTHSWLEPTAFAVLALRASGQSAHARTREALRLLEDRLLATGGCNYGNTTVLGSELRAHAQPTGIVLTALAGERSAKLAKSIDWLRANLAADTSPASLAWGLMGLRAQDALPAEADTWLAEAAARLARRGASPAKLALIALAANGWPANTLAQGVN